MRRAAIVSLRRTAPVTVVLVPDRKRNGRFCEVTKLSEQEQAQRNMHPHAEAVLAMNLWNDAYAFKQRGGVMDFWDALDERRKNRCRELVDRIVSTKRERRPLVKIAPALAL